MRTSEPAAFSAPDGDAAVYLALHRRGWRWRQVAQEAGILPATARGRDRFMCLLRHYSFRLFLRDVIKHGDDLAVALLTRYCSPAVARRYLDFLVAARLVRRLAAGRYRLCSPPVRSFGPTLEWWVAQVLATEFGVPCVASLRLERGAAGGDYDIIGWLEGGLLYVETKSSPPRNIDERQALAFLRRVAALHPDGAIFLNDTQLHMAPKIVPLLRRAYRAEFGPCRLERLEREVYLLGRAVYVTNSDPDLVANLGRCLAHRLRVRNNTARP
ncbi:MAG: hypothetical protein HY699_08715 [Deltaproteobacteria bacterium]|nr:hypothetical protein [Deltaproteobacteria bacterium]